MADTEKPPVDKHENAGAEQNTSQKHEGAPQVRAGSPGAEGSSSPQSNNEPASRANASAEGWRTVVAMGALLIAILALIANTVSSCAALKSAKNAGKTAKAAQQHVATAQAALEAAIERDQQDRRAWVGVVNSIQPELKVGVEGSFGVVVANAGKTPAHMDSVQIVALPLPKEKPFVPEYPNAAYQGSVLLYPGMQVKMMADQASGTRKKLSEEDVGRISRGEVIMYVFGKIGYTDVFKNPHCGIFCVLLTPDFKGMNGCSVYNNEADGECEERLAN